MASNPDRWVSLVLNWGARSTNLGICLENNSTRPWVQHDLQYIFLNTGFLVHLIGSTKLVYNLLMAFKIQGTPLHCSLHWKKSLRWQESTGRSSVMTCRLWVSHLIRQGCQQVWDNLMSGDLKPALWTTTGCSTGNEIGVRGGRKYTFANAECDSCYIGKSLFQHLLILTFLSFRPPVLGPIGLEGPCWP